MSELINNELILKEIKKHYGFKKDSDFAKFLGIAPNTLNNWYSRNKIDYNLVYTKCVDISPEYLLTGKGEKLKSKTRDVVPGGANVFNVRLVSQYAYAGYLAGYADSEYIDTLPTVPFVIPEGQTTRGQYLAFEVRGESMDDGTTNSILETDIVLGRLVQYHHYDTAKLHFRKWYFVIVHETEGIIVKQITAHDVERKTITIHSLNPAYPDRELHLSEIKQLYNIVQMIRKARPYPTYE